MAMWPTEWETAETGTHQAEQGDQVALDARDARRETALGPEPHRRLVMLFELPGPLVLADAVAVRNGCDVQLLAPHSSSCRVSCHSRSSSAPAGSARASAADWPAQACMRATSFAFIAASRIAWLSPRCTG